MISTKIYKNQTNAHGYNFGGQFILFNPRAYSMKFKRNNDWDWITVESGVKEYNHYGRMHGLPGKKIYVVEFHRRSTKWRIKKCKIAEVYCFGPLASESLRNYWLDRSSNGHGLRFGESIFPNLEQAKFALLKAFDNERDDRKRTKELLLQYGGDDE